MKEVTHILFGAGCAAVVEAQLRPMGQPGLAFLLVLWLALAVNRVIDAGHTFKDTRYGHIPVRSWVTHGTLTAPAWGALVGAFSVTIPEWALVHVVDLNLTFLAAVLGLVYGDEPPILRLNSGCDDSPSASAPSSGRSDSRQG